MAKTKLTNSGMMLEGTSPLRDSQMHTKEVNGLTPHDLGIMLRRLNTLKHYVADSGDCCRRIDACIEVVQGLADLWTRESYRFNHVTAGQRRRNRQNKVRELKPVKKAGRQLTEQEEEALMHLSGQSLEWMVE